jgi:hypothetical protein
MDRQAVALGRIKQAFPEKLVVVVVGKDRVAVIAPQDDVQWNTFDEVAGETGHIHLNLAYKSSLTPYVCGVTTAKRSAAAPKIPTLAEAGVAGYDMSTWYGLVGPANMPADIVNRLNQELRNVLADPQIREKLVVQGVDPVTGTPEAFSKFIQEETKRWAKIIKESNIEVN